MRITIAAALVVAGCTAIPGTAAQTGGMTDHLNRTVPLARNSDVDIRGINGTVTIETAPGLAAAEIRVSSRASSREALERRPILIESSANSLTIRTEQDRRDRGANHYGEWVRHEVSVRMPRDVNLEISSVNGQVDVGEIAGEVGLDSINGRTNVRHAGSVSHISSINGRTTITVARLADRGLRVSSVNGGIEIGLPQGLNADIDVNSVNGGIDTDLPMTVIGRERNGRLSGRIGNGGPRIVITSVNGGVTLK